MTARDFWIALEEGRGSTPEQIDRKTDHMEDVFELMEMFAEYKINQLK